MAIRKYKATSPALRYLTGVDFQEISTAQPYRPLTEPKRRGGGRNNQGRITTRWRGGGHKRRYRRIDFLRRDKLGINGIVESVEYDPNRSARIALIKYVDGERRYILAPQGIAVGHTVVAGEDVDIRPGNALPLERIPLGTVVHNVELKVGRGGQMVRAAGSSAQVLARESGYAQLRLPSGEVRKVRDKCFATIGQLSNIDHENISIGKAGRTRWLGRNPRVRGSAMNPVDHPHGGGEGKTKGGRHPVSPTGLPTKGYKTRQSKRTDKFIIQRKKKRKK